MKVCVSPFAPLHLVVVPSGRAHGRTRVCAGRVALGRCVKRCDSFLFPAGLVLVLRHRPVEGAVSSPEAGRLSG